MLIEQFSLLPTLFIKCCHFRPSSIATWKTRKTISLHKQVGCSARIVESLDSFSNLTGGMSRHTEKIKPEVSSREIGKSSTLQTK
jgi:hypothetical protein